MSRLHTDAPMPAARRFDAGRCLEWTLGVAAAFLLVLLALVTCADVVGRYLLGTPLKGAFELTELLVAALVFMALPLTTQRGEHVEVDLLHASLPGVWQRVVTGLTGLFSAALLTTLAWRLFHHAASSAADGAVSNALQIPLAPLGYLAAAACALSAVLAVLRGFKPLPEAAV